MYACWLLGKPRLYSALLTKKIYHTNAINKLKNKEYKCQPNTINRLNNKNTVLWYVASCDLFIYYQRFKDPTVSIFYPEDEDSMTHRNAVNYLPEYMASHPKDCLAEHRISDKKFWIIYEISRNHQLWYATSLGKFTLKLQVSVEDMSCATHVTTIYLVVASRAWLKQVIFCVKIMLEVHFI